VPSEDFDRWLSENRVLIDCRSKVQAIESDSSMRVEAVAEEHQLDNRYLQFLDYERILNELEAFKKSKGYYNISLDVAVLKELMLNGAWYSLIIPESHLEMKSMGTLSMYTDFAIMVLKIYLEKFYKYERKRWEDKYLEYQLLKKDDNNFVTEYRLTYSDRNQADDTSELLEKFVNDLQKLIKQHNGIPDYESKFEGTLVARDFQAHLYTPLFFLDSNGLKITISPAGLNDGEVEFVNLLRDYVEKNTDYFEGKGLYLIRNKSKEGIGFFVAGNFYPDFILWIDTPGIQYISFIDPKGLRQLAMKDPKIELYADIKKWKNDCNLLQINVSC
jgi:hypothetical protein